jgi:hypothetical protein
MTRRERNSVLCALKLVGQLAVWIEETTPRPERREFIARRMEAVHLAEDCLREALGIPDSMHRESVLNIDRDACANAEWQASGSEQALMPPPEPPEEPSVPPVPQLR